MKKIKKLFIFLFIFASLFLLSSNIVNAKKSNYVTNTADVNNVFDGFDRGDLFSGNIPDRALNFLITQETYTVIDKDTKFIWWNVPNIQHLMKNWVLSAFETGYQGEGYRVEDTERWVKVNKDGVNAMEKWGFKIPSPTYLGEYPTINMSLNNIIVPDSIWGWIKKIAKFVFTGKLIEPPNDSNYNSMSYIHPTDYFDPDNTFERWVSLNWRQVCNHMDKGYKLHRKAPKDSCEYNGVCYVKDTVIDQPGLSIDHYNPETQAKEIVQKLQENLGEEFDEVVTSILIWANNNSNGIIDLEEKRVRQMPYDINSMVQSDRNAIKIADPRVEYQTKFLGFLPLSISNRVRTFFSGIVIGIGSMVSELTVVLSQLIDLELWDTMGLSPAEFWKSPIISILITLVVIWSVIKLFKSAMKFITNGTVSLTKIILDFILIVLIVGIFFLLMLKPDDTWNSVKKICGGIFGWGESSLTLNQDLKPLYGTGDTKDNVSLTYWVPYYSLWSEYNTGHALLDSQNKINKDSHNSNETEYNDWASLPSVSGQSVMLWPAVMSDAIDDGSKIDKSIYRMVDHMMAPRVSMDTGKVERGESGNKLTVTMNENYNGDFQMSPDIGILIMIFLILFIVIIKVLLFINAWYGIYTFLANTALVAISPRNIGYIAAQMGMGVLFVGLWGLYASLMVVVTASISGVMGILISIACWFFTIKLLGFWIKQQGLAQPALLAKLNNFINSL